MAEGYDRTLPEVNVALGQVGEDLRFELAGTESRLVLSWGRPVARRRACEAADPRVERTEPAACQAAPA